MSWKVKKRGLFYIERDERDNGHVQGTPRDRTMDWEKKSCYWDSWGNVNMNCVLEGINSELMLTFSGVMKIVVIQDDAFIRVRKSDLHAKVQGKNVDIIYVK